MQVGHMKRAMSGALVAATFLAGATQAATVETTDYIASPTHYMGFEALPDTYSFGDTHVEDGIRIVQVNGDIDDIWTTYLTPSYPYGLPTVFEGERSWYPTSGDFGYTRLTMENGSEFGNIGFMVGSGFSGSTGLSFHFELYKAGVLIQSGSEPGDWNPHWLGFSGGGFDEVRLADQPFGAYQALAIDAIKVSAVPEPETYALMLAGLAALGLARRRQRR